MRRLLPVLLLLIGLLPLPARADDISAAARGVARVVTIAVVDGQVVGFGHGSGFAVAPNRIVTNAHVVELAQRYPENVVIGIVPSEGARSFRAKVIALDARRDLALLEFTGAGLPPATLYAGAASEGDRLVALGYPGNVDLATAQSAADYIHPTTPVRSEGGYAGARQLGGIQVLLHTANIARGNSGGPLLDRCGRVVGVNSALTRSEEGDATFGFAIADTELAGFLRDAGQPYASVGTPCTSIEERLRADNDADARATVAGEAARRDAATQALLAREEALARARADAERRREDVMAVAALLLVAGAQAAAASGYFWARRRRLAWLLGGAGALLLIAAPLVFINRPHDAPAPAGPLASTGAAVADAPLGGLTCRFVPERSRVTVSSTADVALDWGAGGCVNGRTPYVADGARWTRVLAPDGEETVSVLQFDPATRTYTDTRYLLSATQMAAARAARGPAAGPSCTSDSATLTALAARQSAIRATLPPLPNEKLVYNCLARR